MNEGVLCVRVRCTCAYTWTSLDVCVNVSARVCLRMYTCLCVEFSVYVYTHVLVCSRVCIPRGVGVCIRVRVYGERVYVCGSIRVRVCVSVFVDVSTAVRGRVHGRPCASGYLCVFVSSAGRECTCVCSGKSLTTRGKYSP